MGGWVSGWGGWVSLVGWVGELVGWVCGWVMIAVLVAFLVVAAAAVVVEVDCKVCAGQWITHLSRIWQCWITLQVIVQSPIWACGPSRVFPAVWWFNLYKALRDSKWHDPFRN